MATQLQEPVTTPDAIIADGEQERDYETEARAKGWLPPEEFQGDPAKALDAEAYVKRGEEILPFVLKELKSLKRENGDLKKLAKRLSTAESRAYDRAVADLEARQDDAAATGDVVELKRLREEAKQLTKEAGPDVPALKGEDPAEELDTFRESNPWFDKANLASASEVEVEARLYADRLADKWIRQGLPNEIPPSEFYKRLGDDVNAKYPGLGRKSVMPKPPSDVAGVPRPGARGGPKTFTGLPGDAQRQFERFYDDGIYKGDKAKAREKYAKVYWENAQ